MHECASRHYSPR
ncbi:Protein of unknown function [Pyronema omphalodes CBS 100304]|uniref:Uncharacterized protein n=1 Tax=Pyronema omphalodes (strain CBS 100304) TaxID=1076935 RepID=U4L4Z4_PYROM|nr:Protein of unknown function [Pyronema omphalodes CBS 100304]